jgi:hypothetical protein
MKIWIICLLFVPLSLVAGGAPAPGQTVATRHVMQEKLTHTHHILEAVMTSNHLLLQQSSLALSRVPQQLGWMVLKTPEYQRYSNAFVNAAQALVAAADERDLDAAAVHYAALTMTCYQCHRYLKSARIADVDPMAFNSADAGTDGDGQRGARPAPPPRTAPPRSPGPSPQRAAPRRSPSPPQRAVPRPPAQRRAVPSPNRPYRGDLRTEIYPYPFWPPPPFVYRFPWGAYPPGWWDYPYPYGYPWPPPTIEMSEYGSVELDVPQDDAFVYVDGAYAGVVDDFDHGHDLYLVPGPHHVELQQPGFEPLTFDVNIEAGRHLKLRETMKPATTPGT